MDIKECVKNIRDPKITPGYLLWHVANLWLKELDSQLAEADLTHVQYALLVSILKLSQIKDNITQVDIAHFIDVNIMMTSKVLRTLENKKLIKRGQHRFDTRAKSINLTEKGKEVLQNTYTLTDKISDKFFGSLGENREVFINILKTLIEKNSM